MKRIIEGRTYNTETATKVARGTEDGTRLGRDDHVETLYLTRGRVFFVHAPDPDTEDYAIEAMSRDKAQDWLANFDDVDVYTDALDLPPEAEADQEGKPEATIYLRVPENLRRKIGEAAAKKDQSMNAWAMRCLEECLTAQRADRVTD